MFVPDDAASAVATDDAFGGILDACDGAPDVRIYARIFEGEIAVSGHRAVFKNEILAVTKWLRTGNLAVYEGEVLGVPGQKFALDLRINNRNVFAVPKGVPSLNACVPDCHIAAVLKGVVPLVAIVANADVVRVQEKIVAFGDVDVFKIHSAAVPEGFGGVRHFDASQSDIFRVAEHFRGVNYGIRHKKVLGVPDGGATSGREEGMGDFKAVCVPERILPFKSTVFRLHVLYVLQRGFPSADCDLAHHSVSDGEKRTLSAEFLTFNDLHV